jgi:hypothetical protein
LGGGDGIVELFRVEAYMAPPPPLAFLRVIGPRGLSTCGAQPFFAYLSVCAES